MVYEVRKQLVAWIGNGLLKACAFLMEDKMAAGAACGCARNYGWGTSVDWVNRFRRLEQLLNVSS